MVPTDDLVMYEGNAKLHPHEQVDQIAASIEEFNFADPVAAWHNDGGESVIIEGHGRLMAARKLGITELPVIYLDYLTDEQRRAYTLVHNQTTMNSGFDFEILQGELAAITDIDMGQFDFDLDASAEDFGPYGGDGATDESDEAYVPQSETHFNYKEQYGVIVMCDDEDDQERVYNRLTEEGYACKVVAV
jgi:hypothetical protein